MSTAPAPTGALSRRERHPPAGPQTKPFDTTRRPAGRMRIGRVPGVLAVGVQFVFAVEALASEQISYGGCVASDGRATGAPSLTGAISVAVSPEGTTVYVAAFSGRALAVFNRAPAGQLTIAGCVSNEGSGGAYADLRRATDRRQLLASTPRTPPTFLGITDFAGWDWTTTNNNQR